MQKELARVYLLWYIRLVSQLLTCSTMNENEMFALYNKMAQETKDGGNHHSDYQTARSIHSYAREHGPDEFENFMENICDGIMESGMARPDFQD